MKISLAETEAARQACFYVRHKVFEVEQQITDVPEIDEYDSEALHILAMDAGGPVGCARIVAKGNVAKIGRVAVLSDHRGTGLGLRIMQYAMTTARSRGFADAELEAQIQALPFYEQLGFVAEGPEYDDGSGIMHRLMRVSL